MARRQFMEPIGCSSCGDCVPVEEAMERVEIANDALTAAQARIEKLERMVVWCATHSAEFYDDKPIGTLSYFVTECRAGGDIIDCDGTPASILAAVEKAMGE